MHQKVAAVIKRLRVAEVKTKQVGVDAAQLGVKLAQRPGEAAHVLRSPGRDHIEVDRRARMAVRLQRHPADHHAVDLMTVSAATIRYASSGRSAAFTGSCSRGGDLAREPIPAQRPLKPLGHRTRGLRGELIGVDGHLARL